MASSRAPWCLLVAFAGCLLYGCFARGAIEAPAASWLELAVAVVAMTGAAAWLYGNGVALKPTPLGLAGLGGLVAFAAWAAISVTFSVTPDRSWAEANTVLGYALATGVGMLIGTSLPRAAQRTGIALGVVAVIVALYAFAAKATPGILGLDTNGGFSRLRTPLGYWNALALVCVLGTLPLLRAAADPHRRPPVRIAAVSGVFLLVTVLGMTYSRGGYIALLAGTAVLIALSTERVRTLTLLVSALIATVPPLTIGLRRPDLTGNFVPLAQRTDDGLALLIAFLVAGALLAGWTWALIALERRTFTPTRGRAYGRPAAAVAAAGIGLLLLVFLVTGGAGRAFDRFKDTSTTASVTDPNRLLSGTSGNRWVWWREAAGAFSDKPVAGWGAGSSPVTHLLYRKNQLSVQQPHSVPLQWLSENGLVGFVIAVAALGALLAAGFARVRESPWAIAGAPSDRGAAAALLAVAAAWVAQALLEWSWDIPAVTLPVFLTLGVLAARRAQPAPIAARGPALAGVAVAFTLFAVSALLPAIAATQVNAALAIAGEDGATPARLESAARKAELAARLNPLADGPLVAAAQVAVRRDGDDEATRILLRAVRRQPYDAEAWAELALNAFGRGDVPGVRRAALRALSLDPANPRWLGLAARAFGGTLIPNGSATAGGTPLVTNVTVTAAPPIEAAVPAGPSSATPAPAQSPLPVPTPPPVLGGATAPVPGRR